LIRDVRLSLGVAAPIIGFNAVPREGVKLQTATNRSTLHLVTKVSLSGHHGVAASLTYNSLKRFAQRPI
jgi:hypothetical protein